MGARGVCLIVFFLAVEGADAADYAIPSDPSVLVGPVLGLRLGSEPGGRALFGVEGGIGAGPQRLNLGVEFGNRIPAFYFQLDPWFLLGLSLGGALDLNESRSFHPVVGIWEGVPVGNVQCEGTGHRNVFLMSLALGYRYNGVHELYFTPNAGVVRIACGSAGTFD